MKIKKIAGSIVFCSLLLIGCVPQIEPGQQPIENEGEQYLPIVQTPTFESELVKDTWSYLSSDWARANHMPWSWRSAQMGGGDFANTAEIGFLALSCLAAHDLDKSWSPEWDETNTEVNAILGHLRRWQTDGGNSYNNSVFYQWYWINNDPPTVSGQEGDHLVPSIDNAWLAASLIVIREYALANGHTTMHDQANEILNDMDFRLWFNTENNRFHFGMVENPADGIFWDYYSNENRIINVVAYALGDITAEEYVASLAALEKPSKSYGDITVEYTAWDGSFFTYISPALFIRELEEAYGANTIVPATRAQIQYAADQGYTVWGVSDSYSVKDEGYVQAGAEPAFASDIEMRPGLITPHASAMAYLTSLSGEATANLEKIAEEFPCAYDAEHGFVDSVMANRADHDFGACSYRFSALNQEWIFLSLINAESEFIWDYFYLNSGVQLAHDGMFEE